MIDSWQIVPPQKLSGFSHLHSTCQCMCVKKILFIPQRYSSVCLCALKSNGKFQHPCAASSISRLNPCLCMSACTCLVLQSNLARGQSAGDPDQIQCFEGNEHEADVGCQVFGTLWVHEVVSGVAARVFLVAHCGGQIYPRRECDGGTA